MSTTNELGTVTLVNGEATATFANYGATLTHFVVFGKDIALGFDSPQEYIDIGKQPFNPFFGCAVGRTANRIKHGRFELNGKTYRVVETHGDNNLHGGPKGFDKCVFTPTEITENSVTFMYVSPDGEEGFPGTLKVEIKYTLHANPIAIQIDYLAYLLDSPEEFETVVNLTNHSYFNLTGLSSPTIESHTLEFPRNSVLGILEMDDGQCPTGKIDSLSNEFNFSAAKPLGKDLESNIVQRFKGYDHFYMLSPTTVSASNTDPLKMPVVATVEGGGLALDVMTTCPGFQLYTGQHIPPVNAKKSQGGEKLQKYAGFAIETSFPPDAINRKDVGWDLGTVVGKRDTWKHSTVYVVRKI